MANYRGLNIAFDLADIDNKSEAFLNLGLDVRDLDPIRGLSAGGVTQRELRMISGLDLDQKKEFYALSRTSSTIGNLLRDMRDIQVGLDFNMRINNQIKAGAIKYDFIDWASPTTTKSADISTSRVSSWSSTANPVEATSPIFYGGQVKVIGNKVTATNIETLSAPVQRRYPSEVPTHLIEIDVNGVTKQVHAMKGIPLIYEGFFKNANLGHRVNNTNSILPVWTVQNLDDSRFYETFDGTNPTVGANDTYRFRDSRPHPREISFYYDPSKIERLSLEYLNLTELPNVSLPAIVEYNLVFNDFYDLPNFEIIAPALQTINMTGNNLSRSSDVANVQLQRMPTTMRTMTFNGCFSDSTDIDLTKYTSLETLSFNSYYSSYGNRRMTGGTVTPKVTNAIVNYYVTHQPYSRLSSSVAEAPGLVNISISALDVTAVRNDSTGVDEDVYFDSTALKDFVSYSNNHNIVKMNTGQNGAGTGPRETLERYYHVYSSPRSAPSGSAGADMTGKFTSCSKLNNINVYATSASGDINNIFRNIPELDYIEARWTSISGNLTASSFTGSEKVRRLHLAGSALGTSAALDHTNHFFGTEFQADNTTVLQRGQCFSDLTNFQVLYLYSNRNVKGFLPDFSSNRQLRVIYMPVLGLSGTVGNFSQNPYISGIYLHNNYFTGSVPGFNGDQFYYLYFQNNQFSGNIPVQSGSNIRRFYVHYNNLSGTIPSFSFCPRLEYAYFNNNSLTGCFTGSFSANTRLRRLELSNNNLSLGAIRNIIQDMADNYLANPRGGVTVNMLGQTSDGQAMTEALVIEDETTRDNLALLRLAGWTVLVS